MRSILNPLHMETLSYSFGWGRLPLVAIALAVASTIASFTGSPSALSLMIGAIVVAFLLLAAEGAARWDEKRRIRAFLADKHLIKLPSLLSVVEAKTAPLIELTMVHPGTQWIEMRFREDVWSWGMQNLHAPFGVVPIRGIAESWQQPVQCYFATEEDAKQFSQTWVAQ